ncbi:MAG: 50S ribosomal protein L32 [Bacilli bacterium]|nr:50S ribosomal protein L32 [Bacilli bacterium]MDD3895636.1 50S ribosomal protein L32 [Bacilli bacterium]MDD4407701.1 50S ribosomal protein L32 [Bacilli bacterium]
MAVPARRTSKTKKRMRRTHLKKTAPNIVVCPNCEESIMPHRACTKCGYYKGKEIIKINKKES